ncbi:unannotated protein [freshwater metagenome]|uniref:inositol-phosphate phosphatase n=1 Tax=freshwater metagenome TaxID=449393 RepID=A0A6J7XWI8_9ZZZZ|nr:inositol monophosphatase [Actinomycetota bacterium]
MGKIISDRSEINELLALAIRVGGEAADLLSQRPEILELSTKSSAMDIVTQMDKASEAHIVKSILEVRPDDGMIGEEGASRPTQSGVTWVIDPLDGTVNYFYGLPGWNVSIAAKDESGAIVGCVTAPTINSRWHASRGGGAFLNDSRISCNDPIELNRALIGTGFSYDVTEREEQLRQVALLLPRCRDIRRFGAAAVDLCCVASGQLDGYFEAGLMEWDLAAGALIASEAGARVTKENGPTRSFTLAAGPYLHPLMAQALAE